MNKMRIRVVQRGKIEVFEHDPASAGDLPVPALVDYFEGHVGVVLSIHDAVTDETVYQSMVNPWEAGVT